jgi:hypothetical protein
LTREFLARLTEDLRANIRAVYDTFRLAIIKSSKFRISSAKIRNGTLVAAADVFSISKDPIACGLARPFLTEYSGSLYRIDDYYCINPSCECNDTHLVVSRTKKAARRNPRNSSLPPA